jgi:hypothetical protein
MMLTLFKPWRSGLDLKIANQSWDDAYTLTDFSQHQNSLMDNFNLRYECMDARNDFHTQLKKGEAILPSWGEYSDFNDNGEPQMGNDPEHENNNTEYCDMDLQTTAVGRRELKRRRDMAIMKELIERTGWTEAIPRESQPASVHPEVVKSGNQWKTDVKNKRQELLTHHAESTSSIGKPSQWQG